MAATVKISDLQRKLQEILDLHGDMTVLVRDNNESDWEDIYLEGGLVRKRDAPYENRTLPDDTTDLFFGVVTYEIGDWFRQVGQDGNLKYPD